MESLPYIRGCVRESLRWMATTPMLVPHAPLKDDEYQDYIVPAGKTIVLNVWALNMDPENWPNPHYEIATPSDPASVRHDYVFRAGRRLCQGIHIAERSLFLAMACLLWAFNISTPDPGKIDAEDLRGVLAVVPAPQRANVVRREWRQLQTEFLHPVTKQWRPNS
ncbi:cytochrome P450 [Hypoxylon sp. FL0890]|nr:cytochrome P450 [Hypoxylon sp. FL0890]